MTPIQERVAQMLARIGPDDLWRNSYVQPMISLMRELLAENEKLNRWLNYRQVSESTDICGNLTVVAVERPISAFTGRQTGRNRPDIPSDAGVPPREQDAGYGEGWSVEPLGTFARRADAERGIAWPDEQRIDTIAANGPTGLHYPAAMCNDPDGRMNEDDAVSRAIGQPGTKA